MKQYNPNYFLPQKGGNMNHPVGKNALGQRGAQGEAESPALPKVIIPTNQQLIEFKGHYGGTTNKKALRLLYSIKNRKFIKGYVSGDRVGGDINYRIYPGIYLVFDYYYWNKQDPPAVITIWKVQINKQKVTELKKWEIKFYDYHKLEQLPRQIWDFWYNHPGYHSGIDIRELTQKVYSEEENQKLLQLIESEQVQIEGEEHE
jgi:hypothetical protein